jgi:predicted DNA binding CopG/RHH family protein
MKIKKYDAQIIVRISKNIMEKFDKKTQKLGLSMSDYLRQKIDELLQEEDPEE